MKASKIHKLFGMHFAWNVFGNCFSPALVLDTNKSQPWTDKDGVTRYPAKVTLTLRTRFSLETKFYWRGGLRFDFNSGHLARRFGRFIDTDFGGVYQLESRVLGNHIDL